MRICAYAVLRASIASAQDPPPVALTVASAGKKLRSKLGDSQQAFANRRGLSVRAIANYERGRRPSGAVLFEMVDLAT